MMSRTRITILSCVLFVFAGTANADVGSPPDFSESRVFYEMFAGAYGDDANLDLLPNGRIRLDPLGTMSVADFNWRDHARTDKSWWQRIENFEYLLPFLKAGRQEFVRGWFETWYAAHRSGGAPRKSDAEPNSGTWDPMTTGIRVMMMTYMLRAESRSANPNTEWTRQLKSEIKRHQRFLIPDAHFDANSNHGMWEAMGLFETTRVYPNPALTNLALKRLTEIVELSVSSRGTHREHSPSYHFFFMKWLTQYVEYLQSLPDYPWPGVMALAETAQKMHRAAHYLCDHKGELPQIGDTDKGKIVEVEPSDHGPFFFDAEAGYAVFKDPKESSHRRYVVFRTQSRQYPPDLPHHIHNDLLSVYVNYDGEVILGDQGRLSYSRSAQRSYLMSIAAHNTLFPSALLVPKRPGLYLAERVWRETPPGQVVFAGGLARDLVTRFVRVPVEDDTITIEDAIRHNQQYLLLWHIGPDVKSFEPGKTIATAEGRQYEWNVLTKKQRRYKIQIQVDGHNEDQQQEMSIVRGQKDPYLGWYSSGYNQFDASPVIKLVLKPTDVLRVRTQIKPQP